MSEADKLIDISPAISEHLAVWPGDTSVSREILCEMAQGDTITLSTLRATVHLGAHADAPSHYGMDAPSIEARPLSLYLGPCQVIRPNVTRGARLTISQVRTEIRAERILFATETYPNPNAMNQDFAALDPELVTWLAEQGVKLIGLDTPSVDLFDSKDLPSHQACLRHDMAILEGLRLEHVPEGEYELIALPLKLVGFDASPVRAVLRSLRSLRSNGE